MASEKDSPDKKSSQAPPVVKEADWEEIALPFHIGSGRSIYSGLEGDSRIRMRVFRKASDQSLIGRVWFGPGTDGPPGHVHGGAVAYVLDEAMGSVAWMNHYPVVAAKLEFQYLRMTPLQVDLTMDARILKAGARSLETEARLLLPSGEPCVTSLGRFAILTKSKITGLGTHAWEKEIDDPRLKWAPDSSGDNSGEM